MYYYECLECGARYISRGYPRACGRCDGPVQNRSVDRRDAAEETPNGGR